MNKINNRIGYARISTSDQNLDLQLDALNSVGCLKIFQDITSGAKSDRPHLNEALNYLREGDVLVVWKLDRLGRSLKHLVEIISELKNRGIGLWCLQENIDTTTNGGMLVFHIFASLAEFERGLIIERTQAGLKSARSRGIVGGRPKKLNTNNIKMAQAMMGDGTIPIREICNRLGICKATLYK